MTYRLVTSLVSIFLLSATQVNANTNAQRPDKPEQAQPVREKPQITLPERANGQKALTMLRESGKLPEFATFYGLSQNEVVNIFRNDPTAFVDRTGSLHFVEPAALNEPIAGEVIAPNSGANQASFPLDQTFLLESKPGSSKTLFLDFDGHVTQNTAWNNSYGISTINSPAFDLDGNPGTFSTAELQRIQNIWKRVAEDYAPFDVNVTTRDLGVDAIVRSSSTDNIFGSHQVITRDFTKSTNSPCGCGGFAYVGVFDFTGSTYKPAFVFYDNLGNGNEKYVAEAASHEAGHNMGLGHDGTSSTGYYTGHGSGDTGWAPIMGVGYYKPLVQWSKGEYSGANQTQDDYAVMQQNSLYFDADEYGDSVAQAQALQPDTANGFANFAAQGTLQGPNDSDVFDVFVGAGSLSVSANPFNLSPNVDIRLSLYDAAGALLATSNPLDFLNATINFNILEQGNYFVRVEGTGKGDPLGTGYTKYGSVGIYTVAIQGQQPGEVGPVAPIARISHSALSGDAPLTVSFDAADSTDQNGDITGYSWNFGNGQTAMGVQTSQLFDAAGTYDVTLTVTDSTGLTGTATVRVIASEPEVLPEVQVANITMEGVVNQPKGRNKSLEYSANALILVNDADGNCVENATVQVQWSGVVNGTAQALTSCSGGDGGGGGGGKGGGNKPKRIAGVGAVVSSPTSNVPGTFEVKVDNVVIDGYQFVPGNADQNSVTVQ